MSIQNVFEPNKIVLEVTDVLRNRIIELEKSHDIPAGYLKSALALHIPRFSEEEIYADGNVEFQNIFLEAQRLAEILSNKISQIPIKYHKQIIKADKLSKVKHSDKGIIEIDTSGIETLVEFRSVDPKLGDMIQEKLHYIGQKREDTLFHFGLYRRGDEFPFAYSAYSILDRNYLYEALPFKCKMDNILVLTRAFNINSAPVNSMSLLFSLGVQFIENHYKHKYLGIISAINPNILFNGSIFKGSSFFTFATVPFIPLYYKGDYITRKSVKDVSEYNPNELTSLKIDCKPTIWMGQGLNKEISNKFLESKIIHISSESYLKG